MALTTLVVVGLVAFPTVVVVVLTGPETKLLGKTVDLVMLG